MLSFDFPEVLLFLVVAAVVALPIAALTDAAHRPKRDFGNRGRAFYDVLFAIGLLLPPLGVITLLRYELDVRRDADPNPSP